MAESYVVTESQESNDHDFDTIPCKILVLGDYGVGKTSIIRSYVDGSFTKAYKVTIGVDFVLKRINWKNDKALNLQFWDVAGNERNCGLLTRVYYRYASAAIIVADCTRQNTFESVKLWVEDLNDKLEKPIPKVLFINKCDLNEAKLENKYFDKLTSDLKLNGWFAVSAKTQENINESFNFLISEIMKSGCVLRIPKKDTITDSSTKKLNKMSFLTQIDSYLSDKSSDIIKLDDFTQNDDSESKCC